MGWPLAALQAGLIERGDLRAGAPLEANWAPRRQTGRPEWRPEGPASRRGGALSIHREIGAAPIVVTRRAADSLAPVARSGASLAWGVLTLLPISLAALVAASATPADPTPAQRAAAGRDPLHRCAALPVGLQDAPHRALDLNEDGWRDRLLELPGSCLRSACTWRVYQRCPEGGHRALIELIATRIEPLGSRSAAGWADLLAVVPAPSNQPQAWQLRFNPATGMYDKHAPAAAPARSAKPSP